MRRGLVVGKFMPLHRGHQLLIESALAEVDDLTVVVYDSAPAGVYPAMPIDKRAGWISALFPQIENIVLRDDIFDGVIAAEDSVDPKYARDYADDLAFLGQFDRIFTSEVYGDTFARAMGAVHVQVDASRTLVPISGTAIRENIFDHRGYIDPLVYRSLIQKVVFVGTESTGKTTLAAALAREYDTKWVPEFGRELWFAQGGTGSFHDFLKIGQRQHDREEAAALHSRRFLFCDTNAWTTLQWSLMYYGSADARLHELAQRTKDEYVWFLCDNDFGWIDDGTRELDESSREFQEQNRDDLEARRIDYQVLSGSLEERVSAVKSSLDEGDLVPAQTDQNFSRPRR